MNITDTKNIITQGILDRSIQLPYDTPSIYFLIQNNEIVYVGQSIQPYFRIWRHRTDGKKLFERYFITAVNNGDLNRLEAEYIWLLTPRYNQHMPPDSKYLACSCVPGRHIGKGLNTQRIEELADQHGITRRGKWVNYENLKPLLEALPDVMNY